tara:strand:- start:409826 stop:411715 length:1890 start_codon:yes stop_codon:yes gene_type:complete
MDSEEFHAPPTTTASLTSYFRQYGTTSPQTDIELVHFQHGGDVEQWLLDWRESALPEAKKSLRMGLTPVAGFSFYTWNAAEFLALAKQLKALLPELLIVAGGPHVQQAEDYLGVEAIDVVFLGEAEVSLQEFLDCETQHQWKTVKGLAFLEDCKLVKTPARERCRELDNYPSPLDVLELTDASGRPLYQSIAYETSRGCPFKCAFCEWGTGAIGSKMYQWSLDRIQRDWDKIVAAGIKDIWLADSNFGALKQDLDKARYIVDLKKRTGLPVSFATSWSKKHSRQVQEIALLLHQNQLLPHYQLALQTLTPEALRLSNRQNMSSNEYEPIARRMSEQGVPIAAELIWGLPGDNLPDFEKNLDQLLATFPNINIFGYTLLPGTEFYERRDEYRIEAIPVAGYGKAKGEYVVGCHSFDREQGEEGYFLISAHIVLVHGYIMPLTTRLLALAATVPVSGLLREVLRAMIDQVSSEVGDLDPGDRMQVYEKRNAIYLAALRDPSALYDNITRILTAYFNKHDADPVAALQALQLDQALCPRMGSEHTTDASFDFPALDVYRALATMTLWQSDAADCRPCTLEIHHPGGVGDILQVADGGSWLRGVINQDKGALPAGTGADSHESTVQLHAVAVS